jgi:hypothetical protein
VVCHFPFFFAVYLNDPEIVLPPIQEALDAYFLTGQKLEILEAQGNSGLAGKKRQEYYIMCLSVKDILRTIYLMRTLEEQFPDLRWQYIADFWRRTRVSYI